MTDKPFRVVREENGYGRLRIEEIEPWRPSRADVERMLSSLAKAYPILVDHASYIDGEFDLALTRARDMFNAFLGDQRD